MVRETSEAMMKHLWSALMSWQVTRDAS